MKQAEEMIRAVRDWAKGMVRGKIEGFKKELDLETILRDTGDASKVTNIFSNYASRTLPASGETLDITLGKIRKYLSDLGAAAFSNVTPTRDYDVITYKIIKRHTVWNDITGNTALTKQITLNKSNAYLIYGIGGATSSSASYLALTGDFCRVYLAWNKGCKDASGGSPVWNMLQLGSVGSTARFTVKDDGSNSTDDIILTIPKGSYAAIVVLELILANKYVNGSGT